MIKVGDKVTKMLLKSGSVSSRTSMLVSCAETLAQNMKTSRTEKAMLVLIGIFVPQIYIIG